jgi:hypothetical protein
VCNEIVPTSKKTTNCLSPFCLHLPSAYINPLLVEKMFKVGGGLRWPPVHLLSAEGQPIDGARVRIQVTAGKGGVAVRRAGSY